MVTLWLGLGLILIAVLLGSWRWSEYRRCSVGPNTLVESIYAGVMVLCFSGLGFWLIWASDTFDVRTVLTLVSIQQFGYLVAEVSAYALVWWCLAAFIVGLVLELHCASIWIRRTWVEFWFTGRTTRYWLTAVYKGMCTWMVVALCIEAWLWYRYPAIVPLRF